MRLELERQDKERDCRRLIMEALTHDSEGDLLSAHAKYMKGN